MGSAAIPAVIAGGGALLNAFGGKKKPKDQGIYGMTGPDRKQLGSQAFGQINGIYDTDPHTFWGESVPNWSDRMGVTGLPDGGLDWNALTGGGGGGGQIGWNNVHWNPVHWNNVVASLIDRNQPWYKLRPTQDYETGYLSKGKEHLLAQEGDQIRLLRDRAASTGADLSSPALLYQEMLLRKATQQGLADSYRDVELGWLQNALDANETADLSDQGAKNNASIVNSQGQLSAASTNSQGQLSAATANSQGHLSAAAHNSSLGEAAAARRSQAAQYLLGLWDRNQDRDLDRYQLLNNMNMGWQQPIGTKQYDPGPTFTQRLLSGAGSGLGLYSGLGGFSRGRGGTPSTFPTGGLGGGMDMDKLMSGLGIGLG